MQGRRVPGRHRESGQRHRRLSRRSGGHIGSDEAGGRHESGIGDIVMETGKVSSPTSTGATAAASGVDRAGLQQAAKAFEAIFMRQMISSMRSAKLGEDLRSEEHTSELQSLMRISYAVFCLK